MLQRESADWASTLGSPDAMRDVLDTLCSARSGRREETPPETTEYLTAFTVMFLANLVNNLRYKDSWCRRGQQGIFHNIARKFDRLEAQILAGCAAEANESVDMAVYSWMHLAWQLRNCPDAIRAWALKEGYWEQVTGDSIWGHRFPPWYKQLRWTEPYIFHCNIKSPKRMVLRRFWMDYMIQRGAGYPTLEAYAEFRVQKDWGMTMEEAEKKVQEELMRKLVPYDKTRFGELPKVLEQA